MSDRLTRPTAADVEEFLDTCENPARLADARQVLAIMTERSGEEAVMWGPSTIGFGRQPYTTADGKHHEWFALGLSPRKAALTLYGLTFYGSNEDLVSQLGTYKQGKGCLYVKNLDDIDRGVLGELIDRAWEANHTPLDADQVSP